MRDPLDLGLVRRELSFPSSWSLSELHDTVLDKSTWCSVLGPNAGWERVGLDIACRSAGDGAGGPVSRPRQ